jgi:hypothetical protein
VARSQERTCRDAIPLLRLARSLESREKQKKIRRSRHAARVYPQEHSCVAEIHRRSSNLDGSWVGVYLGDPESKARKEGRIFPFFSQIFSGYMLLLRVDAVRERAMTTRATTGSGAVVLVRQRIKLVN